MEKIGYMALTVLEKLPLLCKWDLTAFSQKKRCFLTLSPINGHLEYSDLIDVPRISRPQLDASIETIKRHGTSVDFEKLTFPWKWHFLHFS